MKKFIKLLPIILTASCATPQETQCVPAKNYIISNPELMEKYKEEFKNGEIKSYYYDSSKLNINKGKICKDSNLMVMYGTKKKSAYALYFLKLKTKLPPSI